MNFLSDPAEPVGGGVRGVCDCRADEARGDASRVVSTAEQPTVIGPQAVQFVAFSGGPDSNVPTGPLGPNWLGCWYSTCRAAPTLKGARWDQWAERPHFQWSAGFQPHVTKRAADEGDVGEPRKFVAKSPARPLPGRNFRYGYVNLQRRRGAALFALGSGCCGPLTPPASPPVGFRASACRAARLDRHPPRR